MSDDFDADLTPDERDLADRLGSARPTPPAAFRGALGRYLAESNPGYGPRPEGLRLRVSLYLLAGLLLIAFGAALAVSAL